VPSSSQLTFELAEGKPITDIETAIAERLENQPQVHYLIQSYSSGKPMPFKGLTHWLQAWQQHKQPDP
jgi:hypothetical protein